MKYKIIYGELNSETGISTVSIQNADGIFTATSKAKDGDEEYISRFFGCECAENKAVRKAIKFKIKQIDLKLKTLNEVYEEFMLRELKCPRHIFLMIKRNLKYKESLQEEYNKLSEDFQKKLENRENYLRQHVNENGVFMSTAEQRKVKMEELYKQIKELEKIKK